MRAPARRRLLDGIDEADGPVVKVVESLCGVTHTLKTPKTRNGRRKIALDPDTVLALRAHRARQAEWALLCGPGYDRSLGLVNPAPDGKGGFWTPVGFSIHYRRFTKRQGVSGTYHDLRHAHGWV